MGRVRVTAFVFSLALLFPLAADAVAAPTLTSPANGAIVYGGQPTFSGTASTLLTDAQQVTVHVCNGFVSGCTAGGVENRTTSVNPSTGHYSVAASPALADGKYTAETEQDSTLGTKAFSSPVQFTVHNHAPVIQLSSPGSKPLLNATPTLKGTAETLPGDSSSIAVDVYRGATASGAPARTLHAQRGNGGAFSIKVTPALPDGRYTALASQSDSGGQTGHSQPQTFRIKVHAPAVSLAQPANHAKLTPAMLVFSGQGGTALGDAAQVVVLLYHGSTPTGAPLGTRVSAPVSGSGSWSVPGPAGLAPGVYSAVATQTDDAGHTGRSNARTFRIVPPPHVIGPKLTLDRSGFATIKIGCTALSGSCSGNVLVLTIGRFRTVHGGPVGRLRVMFAYVTVPAGQTIVVRRAVLGPVARVLRRYPGIGLSVKVTFSQLPAPVSAVRYLHVAP